MSHQQDQLQVSGALGDQYQNAASRRSSRPQRAPSDHQESSGMSGSRSRDEISTGAHQIRGGGERKARIIRLAESLDSFTSEHYHMLLVEWFCHLASIAITTFLVQRSLRTQYWEDEGGWDSTWYFGALDQGEVMKAFQFLAKGHELLIALSMGFIVVRLAREQMISTAGIALGLLVSSHRIQSFETLLQGRFRDSFFMAETWRKFGSLMVGVAIVFAAVLVKLAGPSSAILMLPTLKWWPVDFLPGFPQIHTYIQALSNEVCPLSLVDYDLSRWDSLDCESTHMSIWCPGSGWDTLNAWSWSQAHMGTPSNLTMPLSDGYYGRPLSAYPDDGPTVVAMTLHNAMSETLGFLWDLPKEAFNLTAWPEAWFAKRVLLEADTSAPIVATSCNFRLQSDMGTNDVLYFPRVDEDHQAIAVPEDLWKNSSSPEYPKFEWIDFSTQNSSNISIGALITLPIVLNGDEQNGEPLLSEKHQDWAFVPCISIAHWSPVSTLFDDETSRHSISSNLTAEDAYYTTVFGEAPTEIVAIGSNWADLLNVPGRYVENFMGDPANLSSIEALLWRQVMATPSSNSVEPPLRSFARDWFYSNFDTYNFQSDRPDRLIENMASTFLSLVLADGLSRTVDWALISVDITPPGASIPTVVQQGTNSTLDYVYFEDADIPLEGYFTLSVQTSRYGWGWGLSKLSIFAISILLAHLVMVFLYSIHIWTRFIFPSSEESVAETTLQHAPDDAGGLIMMALVSPPCDDLDAKREESWCRAVRIQVGEGNYHLVSSRNHERR